MLQQYLYVPDVWTKRKNIHESVIDLDAVSLFGVEPIFYLRLLVSNSITFFSTVYENDN